MLTQRDTKALLEIVWMYADQWGRKNYYAGSDGREHPLIHGELKTSRIPRETLRALTKSINDAIVQGYEPK